MPLNLTVGDVNGGGRSDPLAGANGENDFDGAVTCLPSGGTKIVTTGARSIPPSAIGVSTGACPVCGPNAAT
ncbi:hypothetical protein [Streptomyces minutiscleroticus]|uniref:Uncharacterized protein n=1 Tax=Streptomyces minutiscleroticus TaxID=68238 RepID=A0A918KSI1_9ACTN|nr:hypothetical protein [Streptomyces minutiscleroticus]GGX74070.1 hypothetical protein GCM10010358_30550 [Streptomyces minutiscleroticus]